MKKVIILLLFMAASASKVFFYDPTQNVNIGIGTASSGAPLYIVTGENSNELRISRRTRPANYLYIKYVGGEARIGTDFTDDMVLYTNNTEAIRIKDSTQEVIFSGGNVGIDTSSPASKLDVNGITRTHQLYLRGDGSNWGKLMVEYDSSTQAYYAICAPQKVVRGVFEEKKRAVEMNKIGR